MALLPTKVAPLFQAEHDHTYLDLCALLNGPPDEFSLVAVCCPFWNCACHLSIFLIVVYLLKPCCYP